MKILVSLVIGICFFSCGRQESASHLKGRQASISENYRFPIKPNLDVTPGKLCERASEFRYPEHIKYCERNVDRGTKADVFSEYDTKFGYQTRAMERMAFKIDHLIPLCMGGSNSEDNLWPQHNTVYELTDPIEPFLCDLMSVGRLKQAEAVQIILEVKQDPASTDARMSQLH